MMRIAEAIAAKLASPTLQASAWQGDYGLVRVYLREVRTLRTFEAGHIELRGVPGHMATSDGQVLTCPR